jgi:hypothetical protein
VSALLDAVKDDERNVHNAVELGCLPALLSLVQDPSAVKSTRVAAMGVVEVSVSVYTYSVFS